MLHKKSSFVRTGIFTYYFFTIHSSLNTNEDFEVISKSEKGRSKVQTRFGEFVFIHIQKNSTC